MLEYLYMMNKQAFDFNPLAARNWLKAQTKKFLEENGYIYNQEKKKWVKVKN